MLEGGQKLPGALKILHSAFVLLRRGQAAERPEILTLTRFGVFFSRIEAIFAGFKFPNHALNECKRIAKS